MHTIFLLDPPRLLDLATPPEGATLVTPERAAELRAGLAAGQLLAAGGDGAPILRDPRWWWSASTRGFYLEGLHASVPPGAAEITADEHDALLAGESDGLLIVADETGRPILRAPAPPSLEEVKARALARIDREAENARGAFLTPGAGQALEYEATRAEAARIESDPAPDAESYPMLQAECLALAAVGIVASLSEVGATVRAQTAAWNSAGAAIKAVRRSAKLRVEAAADADAVATIVEDLAWPAP